MKEISLGVKILGWLIIVNLGFILLLVLREKIKEIKKTGFHFAWEIFGAFLAIVVVIGLLSFAQSNVLLEEKELKTHKLEAELVVKYDSLKKEIKEVESRVGELLRMQNKQFEDKINELDNKLNEQSKNIKEIQTKKWHR